MDARVDDLAVPRRWQPDGRLRDTDSLPAVLTTLATLHAEALGARAEIGAVRVRVVAPLRFGTFVRPHLRAASAKDQAAERKDRSQRELQVARAGAAARRDAEEAFEKAADAWRRSLEEVALAARTLVADLEQAEEERLLGEMGRLADVSVRAEAAELLARLAEARWAAHEREAADDARGYGPDLRARWLAPRSRLLRLLARPGRGA
jgi:hypothetical protein